MDCLRVFQHALLDVSILLASQGKSKYRVNKQELNLQNLRDWKFTTDPWAKDACLSNRSELKTHTQAEIQAESQEGEYREQGYISIGGGTHQDP